MAQEQSSTRERVRIRIHEPRQFRVIIHNDDFTPMEFVVMVLMQVFFKSEEEATHLMLTVHHSERATAGIYPYDTAMSKAEKATGMARSQGFPLKLTVEPIDNPA